MIETIGLVPTLHHRIADRSWGAVLPPTPEHMEGPAPRAGGLTAERV